MCFMRVNTGEQVLGVALPLLRALARGHESLVVLNFGLWHHNEDDYRQLLYDLVDQVIPCPRACISGMHAMLPVDKLRCHVISCRRCLQSMCAATAAWGGGHWVAVGGCFGSLCPHCDHWPVSRPTVPRRG